jgi:hypothetical protein
VKREKMVKYQPRPTASTRGCRTAAEAALSPHLMIWPDAYAVLDLLSAKISTSRALAVWLNKRRQCAYKKLDNNRNRRVHMELHCPAISNQYHFRQNKDEALKLLPVVLSIPMLNFLAVVAKFLSRSFPRYSSTPNIFTLAR